MIIVLIIVSCPCPFQDVADSAVALAVVVARAVARAVAVAVVMAGMAC